MPDLKLNVDVTGAQKGAADLSKIANATKQVGDAAAQAAPAQRKAAESINTAAQALENLGGRNNAAKDVVEGVTAAMRGGEGAIFGFAKALSNLKALFAGGFGGIGLLITGLTLAISLLVKFKDALIAPKKSAEELAAELAKAKKQAEELGKARIEQLTRDLESIKTQAQEATAALADTLASQQRISDQEKTTALAVNRNDSTLTEAERTAREFQINDRFAKSEDERKVNALAQREAIAKQALESEKQVNAGNEAELKRALAVQNELDAKKRRLAEIPDELVKKNLQVREEGGTDFQVEEATRPLRDERRALSNAITPVADESAKARIEAALAAAQKGRDAIFVQEKAVREAGKKLADERDTQAKLAPLKEVETKVNEKAAVKTASKADTEKAKALQEKLDELGRKAEEAQASGDFGAQSDAVFERKKLLQENAPKTPAKPFEPAKVSTFAPKEKKTAGGPDPLKEAADEIKGQSPPDLQPIADSSQQLADSVKAQNEATAQSAANVGGQISALASSIPPPPDIATPILNGVQAVATTLKAGQDNLQNQVDALSRRLATLAQSLANSRSQ